MPTHLNNWRVHTAPDNRHGLTQSYVARVYQSALQRQPNLNESSWWVSQIDGASGNSNCMNKARWFQTVALHNETAAQIPINTSNGSTNLANRYRRMRRPCLSGWGEAPA